MGAPMGFIVGSLATFRTRFTLGGGFVIRHIGQINLFIFQTIDKLEKIKHSCLARHGQTAGSHPKRDLIIMAGLFGITAKHQQFFRNGKSRFGQLLECFVGGCSRLPVRESHVGCDGESVLLELLSALAGGRGCVFLQGYGPRCSGKRAWWTTGKDRHNQV